MADSIPLACPNITQAEIDAVTAVLQTPRLSLGPKLEEFEARFTEHCRTRHAVACSSGTAALHLAMRAIGVQAGEEVITTPFSFVASANCALMVGAEPVFVDIDPATWNLNPDLVEAAITPATRAVIPVDVFGQVADMDPIVDVARRHDLVVIEDACEALGSRYKGKPAGSLGDVGVFGFYPNKQITTGEGGMIVTDNAELARMCRSMRNQGRDEADGWLSHQRLGYNYRISELNCALGIVQLQRIEEIVRARRRIEALYRQRLAGDARIRLQGVHPDVEMSWFVFVIRLVDEYGEHDRDRVLEALCERGIGCSAYFAPIHLQPLYRERFGFKPGVFPVCEGIAARTIALPFHHRLTESHVDRVCTELSGLL